MLYAIPDAPRIVGKRDEDGRPLFPSAGRLDTNHIAVEIGRRLLVRTGDSDGVGDSDAAGVSVGASALAWNKPVPRPPAVLDGTPAVLDEASETLDETPTALDGAPAVLDEASAALDGAPAAPDGAPAIPRSGIAKRPHQRSPLALRVAALEAILEGGDPDPAPMERTPYFCPGCPHNTSTRVPEGSRALAGIGCHYLAQFMDRSTAATPTWAARAQAGSASRASANATTSSRTSGTGPTSIRDLLSIRAAIAADVNVTFKILYNDAVAMTGGQPMDGPLTVPAITRQMEAEGARRIAVVTDEPEKYGVRSGLARGTTVYHRRGLDAVQRAFREIAGVTVIVYDQTCAAEKRRRRKRGKYPDPPRRAFINPAVCEGCGDCGVRVELRGGGARGDRVRKEARHRPVVVQQGLLLRRGVLPELRHRARRPPAQGAPAYRARAPRCPRCRNPRFRASTGRTRSSSPGWEARGSSPSARCWGWPPI